MKPASWLTANRIRIHGLLLAVCLWTVYAVDMSPLGLIDRNGLVKGTDFLHFYTLGRLALQGRRDLLYNMRAQAELAREVVARAPSPVYVPLYGPQISMFFAPFARLPYGWALTAWLAMNTLIYAFSCYAVWKTSPNLRTNGSTILILAIAFPGFFHLLAWGQSSGIALLCFTLAFLALRSQRYVLAGFAIGSLIFKPQLGLAAAVVFVFAGQWKVVGGAVMAACFQLAVAWVHYGTKVMHSYWHALSNARGLLPLLEPRLYQTDSLRSFWSLLLPWPDVALFLYLITAIGALVLAVQCWRSKTALSIRFSSLLFVTVLVSPHLTAYDLVVLAPAFLLLADLAASHYEEPFAGWIHLLLYLCYPLFLMGPLARITHLQLSVVAMAALLAISWRMSSLSLPSAPNTFPVSS